MNRCSILIIGIGAMISCSQPKQELPFSEEKTVLILSDMYIMEAALTGKRNDEADSLRKHYQQLLLEDYQMDSLDLVRLSKYLEQHPEHSQELHDQARKRIDHLQRTVN